MKDKHSVIDVSPAWPKKPKREYFLHVDPRTGTEQRHEEPAADTLHVAVDGDGVEFTRTRSIILREEYRHRAVKPRGTGWKLCWGDGDTDYTVWCRKAVRS